MQNKRRGPDFVIKVINTISGVSWILIFLVFLFISMAKPKFQGFSRGMGTIQGSWDAALLNVVAGLLVLLIALSAVGIIFNFLRMKRKTDRIRATLVLSGVLALVGLLALIFR
jgi:hypothetical protein